MKWCAKQDKGITIIQSNDDLAKEYFSTADETLAVLKEIREKSNMWLATTKYYCEYFAVYALFMKLGIRCEIHDCTIALSGFLEKEGLLPKGSHRMLQKDKQLRIDNQYYLKNQTVEVNYEELLEFVLQVKDNAEKLTFDRVANIRNKLHVLLDSR